MLHLLTTACAAAASTRLICSDVDGTLLTPRHRPTARTVQTVLKTMEQVDFCTCTGRGRFGAYNALGPIGDALRDSGAPGVFLNGLLTYGPGGDEILSEQTLPTEVVGVAAAFAEMHGAKLVGFQRDTIVCDEHSEWSDLFPSIYEPSPIARGPWKRIIADGGTKFNKLIVLAPPERHQETLRPLLSEALSDSASLTMAVPTMCKDRG